MKKVGQLLIIVLGLVHVHAQPQFTNGLLAYYPLDGNAYDFSGNGAHGTFSQVSFGNDRFSNGGRAAVFAGSPDSNVRITSTNWNLASNFTASVWFFFTANAGTENPRVLSTAGWEIGTETTGPTRRIFLNTTTASAGGFTIYSSSSFPANAWVHAVAVKSSNQLILYVNGALAGSVSVPQPPNYSLGLPEIGGNLGNGFDAFAGGVDDIRIYNRALSAVEVQQLATFESTRPSISLTANLWPNASFEIDSNGDGTPDFWNKGGSDPSLNFWETNYFNSGSHSLAVWDTSPTSYGGWFSDNIGVAPGERYQLTFKRRYCSTGPSGMRVSARYSSSSNIFMSAINFPVIGCQLAWEEVSSELVVPAGAALLNLEIVSGGAVIVVGTNWIDDISLTRLWPNPNLELDADNNGAPDFWNRGGTLTALDGWDTNAFVSGAHSLALWDNSSSDYAHWYSDTILVTAGDRYTLSFKRRNCSDGPNFFSARYYGSNDTFVSAVDFPLSGCQLAWEQVVGELVIPAGITKLDVGFVSGGGPGVIGTNWIDDVSVSIGTSVTLISTGSVWRYLDNGSDQGTSWVGKNFDDSSWVSGPAQLGFGDGDEATLVSYGPEPTNKFVTTYFRHAFAVQSASLFTNLTVRLLRDDGAVVYLNGVEIWRSNMPTNQTIDYLTLASSNVGGANETTYFQLVTGASLLTNGINVVAVEVHQINRTNTSDLSFDLELVGNVNFVPPPQPDAGFYDDFEPDIHTNNWSQFGGTVQANGNGESVSGVNGLWFGGSGSRFATTRPLNTTVGGLIQFYLRFANGPDPTWERPELPAEGVVLEYSLDGTNWANIAAYTNSIFVWTFFQVSIPQDARSAGTFFRWRQLANSGSSFDHWALDDVRIAGPPLITAQPQSQIGYVGSSVALAVTATSFLPATYQWFFNGLSAVNRTNATLTVSNIQPANGGNYFVVISNAAGVVTSAVAILTYSPTLIPIGSVWKYFDQGIDLGTNWVAAGFDDNPWSSGPAQLGYGDGDEATLVSFGPQVNNKYITTYFRRRFNVPDPALFTNLLLRVLRDDGVVVYVNGTEVLRNNLPAGAIAYSTLAFWPVSASDRLEETNYIQSTIPTNVLVGGINTIAVEIHQVNRTSTDISFDLELSGNQIVQKLSPIALLLIPAEGQAFAAGANISVSALAFDSDGSISNVQFFLGTNKLGEVSGLNPFSGNPTNRFDFVWTNAFGGSFPVTAIATDNDGRSTQSVPVNITVLSGVKFALISTGAVWKYLDNGSNQGTNWTGLDFNDNGWSSGPAQLGYGDGDEATVVSYGLDESNKFVTTYFRRTLVLQDVSQFSSMALRVLRDDGSVVYLNGVEIFRSNLPTNAPIFFNTLATTALGVPAEDTFIPAPMPTNLLRNGTNVIAVEIHQANRTSTDISFDLEIGVSGVPGTPLTLVNGRYDPRDSYVATNSALVEIQTAFPNGVILYTLDGTEPTVDSTLYEGPFTVTNNVVVRAIAYTADFSQLVEAGPVSITVIPTIRLIVSVVGSGQVTLNPPGGAYVSNTVVTLTATPAQNWRFREWSGDVMDTNAVINVVVNRPQRVQAIFDPTMFCVDGFASGGGTVFSMPGGLLDLWSGEDNGDDPIRSKHLTLFNGAIFANGRAGRAFSFDGVDDWAARFNDVATTNVDNWSFCAWVFWRGLSSNPGKSSHFIFYNGESGSDGYGLLIFDKAGCTTFPSVCDAPGKLTVLFGGVTHVPTGVPMMSNVWTHVAVTRAAGLLKLFTNGVPAFSVATVNPTPPSSTSGLIKISDQGSSSFNGLIDEMAVFNRSLSQYEVANLYLNAEQCLPLGAEAVITARALPGWRFLKWLGDADGTNNTTSVSMTRNKKAQAIFGTTLAATVSGNGSVSFDPAGGVYPYGTTVRLTATPGTGSYFALWGNAASGSTNPLLFTVTNANPIVSCLFGTLPANQFSLTIIESGIGRVTTSPSANRFANGQTVTLTAVPGANQKFVGWSGDATGTNSPLTVLMDRSRTITAQFTRTPSFASAAAPLPEGFRLTLFGEFGQRYEIDGSTDLNLWTPLLITTNSFGSAQFMDLDATNFPQRFYRALLLP